MAAPDEPTRRVEVPIVDISDDSRCRSVSEERRRRCAAFAALNETFVLGTTTMRRDSQVFAAAASPPSRRPSPPRANRARGRRRRSRVQTPRAAEDSAPDDSAHDDADAPEPAFTKSEVADIVAVLGFLDASQQSIAHGIMRREHADEPPEDLMKLKPKALARVDEYVRELLILPSRADRSRPHRRRRRDANRQRQGQRQGKGRSQRQGQRQGRGKGQSGQGKDRQPVRAPARGQNIAQNEARMAALNIRGLASVAGAVQRRQPSRGGKLAASPKGSPKRRAENSAPGDADARGTPKGASAGASNTRPRRKAVPPNRLIPTFGSAAHV